jgi:hypothetical protein
MRRGWRTEREILHKRLGSTIYEGLSRSLPRPGFQFAQIVPGNSALAQG